MSGDLRSSRPRVEVQVGIFTGDHPPLPRTGPDDAAESTRTWRQSGFTPQLFALPTGQIRVERNPRSSIPFIRTARADGRAWASAVAKTKAFGSSRPASRMPSNHDRNSAIGSAAISPSLRPIASYFAAKLGHLILDHRSDDSLRPVSRDPSASTLTMTGRALRHRCPKMWSQAYSALHAA